MRYTLLPEHREVFHREGLVQFVDLFTKEEIVALQEAIDRRCGEGPAVERVERGFDLWREEELVARLVRRRSLAETAADLFKTVPLRLAFDQLLLPGVFADQAPQTLEQITPIGGVVGAVLIPLEGESIGYATYLRATTPICWNRREATLLVAYCESRAQYLYNPGAPQAHRLKKMGYVFGDRLREESHPTLVRKGSFS